MFTKNELSRIWNIINHTNSGIVKNGKPVGPCFKEIYIPSLETIAELSIQNLKNRGFSVERVSPKKANCIIRVFRHECFIHRGEVYWMHGANAFLKTFDGMYASNDDTTINYSNYEVRIDFLQDEYATMNPHFVDYFFKIS